MTARAEMFRKMDENGDSYITLDEWIDFALRHITGKMSSLPKVREHFIRKIILPI